MQKLEGKLKNIPSHASQVACSINPGLKNLYGESGSVQGKVLTSNNSEENQSGNRGNTLNVVFVLNKHGRPLMPCKPAKASHLLKQGKAKVVRINPFTIRLIYGSGGEVQPITLGVDAGYKKVGFSATTEKQELMAGEVTLRMDISSKLTERRMYRRNRRYHLWYRQARFDNRGKEGWWAPSIRHKLESHFQLIDKIKSLLPISRVVVEVATFDIQKIKNPMLAGIDYQCGEQSGFWNVREYVLHRDGHTCQHCHGKSKDEILQVHHIRGKAEGATDRPEELLTVCKTCHSKHHKGVNVIPVREITTFKAETFMSTVAWKIVNALRCEWTFGYITKHNRIKCGIAKSHANDAFVIANGNGQWRGTEYSMNQYGRNNRCLQLNRKGFKPSIRRRRYALQPHDLVKYLGRIFAVKGTHCLGKRVVLENKKSVLIDKVKLYKYRNLGQFLPTVKTGGFLACFL